VTELFKLFKASEIVWANSEVDNDFKRNLAKKIINRIIEGMNEIHSVDELDKNDAE
jgi:hypothetical protein